MATFCWALPTLILLLRAWTATSDFQFTEWGWRFIYHSDHALLLVIVEESHSCYYTHVDDVTKHALNTCNYHFMQQEIRDIIEYRDDALKASSIEAMRAVYHDLLADFRCVGKRVWLLDATFGDDYLSICPPQDTTTTAP